MANILIIDDVKFTTANLKNILESLNHQTKYTASSNFDAIEIYKTYKDEIDLIFLSLSMPQSIDFDSSSDAIKAILDFDPDAKIIMISTQEGHQTVLKSIQAGAKGYIAKPLNKTQIEESLKNSLN